MIALQANNAVVKEWGESKKEERHKHNHVDLVSMLGIVDLENGVTVAERLGPIMHELPKSSLKKMLTSG